MSRKAKAAAARIFGRLEQFAAGQGSMIPTGDRYIFLDEDEYDVLVGSKRLEYMKLGRHQAAALIEFSNGHALALAGFESERVGANHICEVEVTPGRAVAMLADLEVDPVAGPSTVLNVVAAGSKSDAEYQGHELVRVLALYPGLRLLEVGADVAGVAHFHSHVLAACARRGAHGNGWINQSLEDELALLGEQRIAGLPYEFLLRAVFDLNPTSLFLALYRCLEATYAYTKASELAESLGINKPWVEVARALGNTLSWYPRHDHSLAALLAMPTVLHSDLEALAVALNRNQGADAISTRVAEGVRELRNSLVHYGPTTRQISILNDDWNELCIPLARVVGRVFVHAYAAQSVGSVPER